MEDILLYLVVGLIILGYIKIFFLVNIMCKEMPLGYQIEVIIIVITLVCL